MSLRTQADKGSTVTASHVTSFLLITCSDTHLAVPAGVIRGIVKSDDVGMADVLTILEVYTPVTDLTRRLGLVSVPTADARIIVCGMGKVRRAFLVSGVTGLEDFEPEKITPLLRHFTGPERRWFSGMLLFHQAVALIIDLGWLLRDGPDQDGEMSTALTSDRDREMNEVTALSDDTAPHNVADIDQFEVLELEEATDADDIPWAQL